MFVTMVLKYQKKKSATDLFLCVCLIYMKLYIIVLASVKIWQSMVTEIEGKEKSHVGKESCSLGAICLMSGHTQKCAMWLLLTWKHSVFCMVCEIQSESPIWRNFTLVL